MCADPPANVLITCPEGLSQEDITLIIMQTGLPLPQPWAPPGSKALYGAVVVNSTAKTSDNLTDPFHEGTEAVYAEGLGRWRLRVVHRGAGQPEQAAAGGLLHR